MINRSSLKNKADRRERRTAVMNSPVNAECPQFPVFHWWKTSPTASTKCASFYNRLLNEHPSHPPASENPASK